MGKLNKIKITQNSTINGQQLFQLPEKSVVSWQIKSFPGGKEFLMRASFGLPSVESEEVEGKPPIQVDFAVEK